MSTPPGEKEKEAYRIQDPTLKRCFGIKKKVEDCNWDYLKTVRTLKAPPEPMARLVDVLEFMRQPGREHVGILLDIKVGPALIWYMVTCR